MHIIAALHLPFWYSSQHWPCSSLHSILAAIMDHFLILTTFWLVDLSKQEQL